MSRDNPVWGEARVHGQLLKLGFEVAQSTAGFRYNTGMSDNDEER